MKSILQKDKKCYMCGATGSCDPLDSHHVFGGPNRKLSEKYGLKVWLCHYKCHEYGSLAVHRNAEMNKRIKRLAQEAAMEKYGWTTDDFIRIFGKNYL